MDTFPKGFRGHRKTIILLSVIFTALIAAGVYSYYIYEKTFKFDQYAVNLKSVSGLKNDDITQWLSERKAEVEFFSRDLSIIFNTKRLLTSTSDTLKTSFLQTLNTTKNNHSYDDIFIASLTGDILFSFKENFKKADSVTTGFINTSVRMKDILFRELYYAKEEEKIFLDIISPIIYKNKVIAALIFRINPADNFYPLILKWPVSSKTSEALIVKKDQRKAVYLSELKFAKDAPLTLSIPLEQKDNIAVRAVLGYKGIIEGNDYRNEKVLSIITPVKGTDWILIVKTDNSEIYAEVLNKTLLVTGLAITLILFFVSGLTMAYELEEKKMKLKILAKERDLRETRNEFRTTLYSIGDGVITSDSSGKIQHMNSVAEDLTGWEEYKAAGRDLEDVFTLLYEKDNNPVKNIFHNIINSGSSTSIFAEPVLLKSKSGKTISISDSGSPIKDEDDKISGVVIVFRDQTETRNTEKNLRESEQRYRTLFSNHHTIMLLIDPGTGNILDANPAACNFYGYSKDEFVKIKIFDLNQLPAGEISEKMKMAKRGESHTFLLKHKLSNGQLKDVEVHSSPISLNNKEFLFSIIHDITLKKETEEALRASEEKFSKAFKTSPDSISINRMSDGLFYEINKGFTETFGYTWEELQGRTTINSGIWINPEDRLKLIELLKRDGEVTNYKVTFRRKDGKLRDGLISARIIKLAGEECILTSTRDITEQKRAEAALKVSEDKFSKAFKTSPDSININRLYDGMYIEINEGFTNLTGYTWNDVAGKTSYELGIWVDEGTRLKVVKSLISVGEISNLEARFRLKNGDIRTGLLSARKILINNQECILSITRDITERKIAEEALLASEDKFSKAFKTSPDAIAIHRLSDGMFIEINEGFTEATGYSWDEVRGKTSLEINIWADLEERKRMKDVLLSEGEIRNIECKFRLKNGRISFGLMSARVITVNGEPCIISITRDINDRKRAEEALKESEEHLRAVTENISDGLIITDSGGEFVYWNKAALRMHGFPEDFDLEELKSSDIAINVTTPEGISLAPDQWPLKKIIAGEDLENTDFRIVLKTTGDVRIFNYNGTSVILTNGERLSFVFIKDITLQRKAEEDARTIEKLLNLTGEMAKVGGWEFDVKTLTGTWTDEVARIHDLVPGDPTNVEIGTSFYKGEDRKNIDQAIKEAIELKKPYDLELELYTQKGNHKIVRTIGIPITEGGKVVKIRGIFQDITELKNAEATIRENEMKLRLFIEHTPAAIAMLDKDLKYIAVSARWYTDFSIKDENIIGKSQDEVFPDYPERLMETQKRCLAGSVEKNEEDTFVNPDGVTEWGRWEMRPWYTHTNEIGGIVIFSEIITEKIKARQALQEKVQLEEQIAKIAKTAPGGLTSMRMYPDGRVVIPYASPTWEEIYNIKAEDVKEDASPALKVVHPDDVEMVINSLNEAKEKLKTWRCEFRIINSITGIRWVEGHSTPNLLEDGSILWHGFISDISQRKEAEKSSLEKARLEEQISRIATTAPGGIYSMKMDKDKSATFLYTSPVFEEMHGLTNEEIKKDGNAPFKRVHPEDLTGALQSMNESVFTLTEWTYEFRIIHPERGIIWIEGHASPLPQPDGTVLWHGFLADVTKRKNAEAALHESEEKLRLVVESSEDIYIMQDIDRTYIYVNGSKKSGLLPSEYIGKKPEEIFSADTAENINTKFKKVIETGEPISENELINWKGTTLWLNLRVSPVRNISGKIIGISTVVRDITEQHKAEENIKRLSLGIEQSPAIIVITDKNGNIEYTNPKFSKVTGYTAEEVKGKNPRMLKSGHTTQEEYGQLWKTIIEKKEWRGEFLNKKKNGELYWESAMISPLFDEKGNIVNFIALKEDITELKRITDELIKAKEKAEEMNRLKSYFFANISHELRTPFVGIIGFSEILSERLQDPGEQKMAEAILSSSKRLTETLNKILDISKLEFDKMELYTGMVNLRELVENTANLYSKTAAKKKTSILTDAASAPAEWKTDERLLREILNNLVNNAVKFTSDGEVKISVSTREKLLIIKVTDTGVGIPEEKQEIIWQEFRQASEGYNRSFEGTGLGLSITKKYTSLLGGNISMASKPGVGTEFTVELPELTEEAAEKKRVENEDIRIQQRVERQKYQHKVLYVEDDFISIEFVKEVLQSDFNLDLADRPQIALNMIKENFYDAILLDINLGGHGMNGIELMQEIKNIKEYKNVPVVAVTAYASRSDEQEFLSKGFTHYLSKPFLSRSLTDLLDRIFSRHDS